MISTFEHGMAEEEHGIGGYRMRIPENGCICWKIVYPKILLYRILYQRTDRFIRKRLVKENRENLC